MVLILLLLLRFLYQGHPFFLSLEVQGEQKKKIQRTIQQ